ncbi:PP2C family protein-serine/threonine phosphatase [Aromatoleum sp.]|uniref:PP2C family protein-serine/threonine phosphatase n=1 Tax=Aromatoleum sp. TaxID=2307007 RepID=UPI002FC6EABD
MPLFVETCVARHAGDRHEQQDRAAVFAHPSQRGAMMAVLADGMGGHSGGALAAEEVVLQAKRSFATYAPERETPAQLLEGIIGEAHQSIRTARFATDQEPHSTAVALVLQPNRISWIHCGDSRLYHFRDSRTVSRSQDHSLVAELQRRGRLDEAGARFHPRRHVLLSCLGSEHPPQTELGAAVRPTAGDCFLLCSDGLWAHFPDEELAQTVASLPARAAAEKLVNSARKRAAGAGDNISLVIIRLNDAETAGAARTLS